MRHVRYISLLALLISHNAMAQAPTMPGLLTSVITNDTTTGTAVNKLAKLTSAGRAIIAATADTDGMIGVVLSGAGTTGSVQIATDGVVTCAFDGTATTGDYVQISGSVAGDCKDTGSSSRPTSGQVIGRVVIGGSGAASYTIAMQVGAPQSSGTGTVTSVTCFGTAITSTGTCTTIGQLPGTATNDNAAAGNVGEYQSASAAASAVSLTSGTIANCVTLSLTAGDWDVSGNVIYTGNTSTTIAYSRGSVSVASATEGAITSTFNGANLAYFATIGPNYTVFAPVARVSLVTTSNVFIEGLAAFSVSTLTCGGNIRARRVR
jgi:hypothetical protein